MNTPEDLIIPGDAPHLQSTVRGMLDSELVQLFEYPSRRYLGVRLVQRELEIPVHAFGHDHCPGCAGATREAHLLLSDYSIDLLIGYLQNARNRMERSMTPYVQREIFRAFDQTIYTKVTRAVSFVGTHWGDELRCHELARAVLGYFNDLQLSTMRVVDGMLGAIEHSWLELEVPIAQTERGRGDYPNEPSRVVIIDVYTPGRLPQVQMIHKSALVASAYREESPRTDINKGIVEDALAEIKEGFRR